MSAAPFRDGRFLMAAVELGRKAAISRPLPGCTLINSRAVSVGAGISDWYTYHISNDIPDFTIDYLSGSPFRNCELYVKTAPISNIAGTAHTPMLIQHGTEDPAACRFQMPMNSIAG